MIPSAADIKKKKDNIAKLSKKLTPDGHLKETELVRIMRKAIDSAWMTAANKLVVFERSIIGDMNPETRTKWLIRCEICQELHKITNVQVDHKVGEFQCTTREDFTAYALNRLDVGFDDLQCLCIPCHEIKTLAERQGLSWEEATATKKAIAIEKAGTKKVVDFLKEVGYTSPGKNKDIRREQLVEYFLKEQK